MSFPKIGLQITLENERQSTNGLFKRQFRLKTMPVSQSGISGDIDEDEETSTKFVSQEKVILHLQTLCWEDDNAISESANFEDLEKIIKYIRKHRLDNFGSQTPPRLPSWPTAARV